jgi:hypothetical protein
MSGNPTVTQGRNDSSSGDVRDRARETAETGKAEAGHVVAEAKNHTSRLIGETGDRAREHADQQLGRAAGAIDQLGEQLDDMAANSSQQDGYLVALARDGAHRAHALSRHLDDGGLDGIVDDVTQFARRKPGTFLAASFAVGLVLGRVTRNADLGRIKQEMSNGSEAKDATSASDPFADNELAAPSPAAVPVAAAPGAGSVPGAGVRP